MSRIARRATAGLLALSAAGATVAFTAPTANAATTAASCKVAWGSMTKAVNVSSTATTTAVADVRSGHHACYDRLVFELAGPVGATAASYGSATTHPAALAVVSRSRLVPVGVKPGAGELTGFTTIKGVGYLGKVNGLESVAVVTRARLPYRMFVLKGPSNHNRIVIDVAHKW